MDLWIESAGSGPALVLLHAAIGDARMWQPQWEAFSSTLRVERLDLRGFGRTGLESGPFSWHDAIGFDEACLILATGREPAITQDSLRERSRCSPTR